LERKVRDSYGTSGQVETPIWRKAAGGSPHAPWKASSLERKSTSFKSNKSAKTAEIKKA
jgi:hypothetical protein